MIPSNDVVYALSSISSLKLEEDIIHLLLVALFSLKQPKRRVPDFYNQILFIPQELFKKSTRSEAEFVLKYILNLFPLNHSNAITALVQCLSHIPLQTGKRQESLVVFMQHILIR